MELSGDRFAAQKIAGRGRLAGDHRTHAMNQREPRVAAGLPCVGKTAQVAAEPDEHAILALGVELGAQILEVAGAVDEAGPRSRPARPEGPGPRTRRRV